MFSARKPARAHALRAAPAEIEHARGLDGLRAVSVAAVLLFHLDRLPGGNLGVDAFFVISGWLITSRLLAEANRHYPAVVNLPKFWEARVRRLLPASLLVILTVWVVWTLGGIEVPSLRHDATWALGWASNWGTIVGGGDYWARFGEPSPIAHFWSLAIEEQFYLAWPLVIFALVRFGGRHRVRLVGAISAVLTLASIAFMADSYNPGDATATYMNTFARAHTLLIGALAAAVTSSVGRQQIRRIPRAPVAMCGTLALGIVLTSGRQSTWLFSWGFPLFATAMAGVVVGVADGAGARFLASTPLRWVGDRSYGIYLWHWPVFLLLSDQRAGVHGVPLDVIRVVIAVALAAASYEWLESPIRSKQALTERWAPAFALAVLVVAFLAVSLSPATAPARADSSQVALAPSSGPRMLVAESGAGLPLSSMPLDTSGVVPTGRAGLTLPRRVLVTGDSTAMQLAGDLLSFARDHPELLVVGSEAFPGCGLTSANDGRRHQFTSPDGSPAEVDLAGCLAEWETVVARVRSDEQIDVVVLQVASWDGLDIRFPDGRTTSVLDPTGRAMVLDAYRVFIGRVQAAGADVTIITPSDVHLGWGRYDTTMNDPRRWAAMRAVVDQLPADHIDLYSWLAATGSDTPAGRPDGVHLTPELNQRFVLERVVPALTTPPPVSLEPAVRPGKPLLLWP